MVGVRIGYVTIGFMTRRKRGFGIPGGQRIDQTLPIELGVYSLRVAAHQRAMHCSLIRFISFVFLLLSLTSTYPIWYTINLNQYYPKYVRLPRNASGNTTSYPYSSPPQSHKRTAYGRATAGKAQALLPLPPVLDRLPPGRWRWLSGIQLSSYSTPVAAASGGGEVALGASCLRPLRAGRVWGKRASIHVLYTK